MDSILISGNAPAIYPTDIFFAVLWQNEVDAKEIPILHPCGGEWGCPLSIQLSEDNDGPHPKTIDMVWLSIVEQKFYSLERKLPIEKMESLLNQTDQTSGEALFKYIVVGMAPYGEVSVWTYGMNKSVLVTWMQGEETHVEMSDFMPMNPTVTLNDVCNFYINDNPFVKQNFETNGLPPRDLFDNYMKQFTYRYLPVFEHWDEDEEKWQPYTEEEQETKPVFDYIEEALYDGTHDKLHDGGLLNYHQAGKPKKLAVKWHIKKSEYTAYFWLEDEVIREIFDRFYSTHPEVQADFIIHIDPIKNKYQLALYCNALTEPQIILEEAYQLIVFKNMFEQFRSENYQQPRGAWIW